MNDYLTFLQISEKSKTYRTELGYAKKSGLVAIKGKSGKSKYAVIQLSDHSDTEVRISSCHDVSCVFVKQHLDKESIPVQSSWLNLCSKEANSFEIYSYMKVVTRIISCNFAWFTEVIFALS